MRPRRDARLSWPSWLVTYRDGIPARRRSPIQVLTGPDVAITSFMRRTPLTTTPCRQRHRSHICNGRQVSNCVDSQLPSGVQSESRAGGRWVHLDNTQRLKPRLKQNVSTLHWQRVVALPHKVVTVADDVHAHVPHLLCSHAISHKLHSTTQSTLTTTAANVIKRYICVTVIIYCQACNFPFSALTLLVGWQEGL